MIEEIRLRFRMIDHDAMVVVASGPIEPVAEVMRTTPLFELLESPLFNAEAAEETQLIEMGRKLFDALMPPAVWGAIVQLHNEPDTDVRLRFDFPQSWPHVPVEALWTPPGDGVQRVASKIAVIRNVQAQTLLGLAREDETTPELVIVAAQPNGMQTLDIDGEINAVRKRACLGLLTPDTVIGQATAGSLVL